MDLVAQVLDYAIITLDVDGLVRTWNAGAERVKGYRAEEILGRSFENFYPQADRDADLPHRLLARARTEGRVEHEGWRLRKDGSRFWADVVITALHDDDGRPTGFAKVTRDLTSHKQLEAAQDSFYAVFQHDFRSPVTAIKGFVDLLRQDLPVDRRLELLSRIEGNADRLLAMTKELVDYARLRAGRTTLDKEHLDLVDVAASTVSGLGVWLDSSRVRLSGSCEEIEADRASVERVIVNLVTNALKYSPPESVVEVRCDPGPPGYSRLTVSDEGRGIAAEDVPHIFNEFERGRLARRDGGSGLGLASVKKLVAVHGGAVHIESEVGKGTTITVDFPVRH